MSSYIYIYIYIVYLLRTQWEYYSVI